jgi:hypothetical protein
VVLFSAVQSNSAQYNVQCNSVLCSAVHWRMTQCRAASYDVVQFREVQLGIVESSTVQNRAMWMVHRSVIKWISAQFIF